MNTVLKEFETNLTNIKKDIIEQFISIYKANPLLSLEELLSKLNTQRVTITQSTSFKAMKVVSGNVISAKELNTMYASVFTDIQVLFGASSHIDAVLQRYKQLSEEKINRLESSLKSQEDRLNSLQFIKTNPTHLEAWSIDLQDNVSTNYKTTVYNSNEQSLSLGVINSESANIDAKINIIRVGNPDVFTLPNYNSSKLFDSNKLSAWYELIAYKEIPRFILNLEADALETNANTSVQDETNIGDTTINCNGSLFTVGEYVTVGNLYDVTSEAVKINATTNSTITITPLVNKHHTLDPIYFGRNLVQTSGAVSAIELSFPYPQKINFIRTIPFSSSGIKLLGFYIPSTGTVKQEWSKINLGSTKLIQNSKSYTFDRIITSKLRVIIEQPFGELVTKINTIDTDAKDIAWSVIYEKEFNKKIPELDARLLKYEESERNEADLNGKRGTLANKATLDRLRRNLYKPSKQTKDELEYQIEALKGYTDNTTLTNSNSGVTSVTKYIYEMGIVELELFDNIYHPTSEYISNTITPTKDLQSYSLSTSTILTDLTSIQHSIVIDTGEEIAIPDKSDINSAGEVEAINEYLDIDFDTRITNLRFEPLSNIITVSKRNPLGVLTTFTASVVNQTITIPSNLFDSKSVYDTTYPVKEPDVDIISNLESKSFIYSNEGTNDGAFLELPKNPYIELAIINNVTNWVKTSKLASNWNLILDPSYTWVDNTNSFPSDGFVFDNIYYGRKGLNDIQRTAQLEVFLRSMFANYSGDTNILVERFFNKYTGLTLEENLVYNPITITVNNEEATNLTNYDGAPDTGFITSIAPNLQFRQFSNRVLFPEKITGKIQATYRVRESSVQYKATLFCNKKSNFYTSPLLKQVILSTST